MHSTLSLCTLLPSESLAQVVIETLNLDLYRVNHHSNFETFREFMEREKLHVDCLILQHDPDLALITHWLYGQATLLPAVLLQDPAVPKSEISSLASLASQQRSQVPVSTFHYHIAEVEATIEQWKDGESFIQHAIAEFINLTPTCWLNHQPSSTHPQKNSTQKDVLIPQQRLLTEKLKERLGYLGVYYKRDPKNFLRYLPPDQKQELIEKLKSDYRAILLCYFNNDGVLNKKIDDFVNIAFFTDISVSQIVEVHMELMDEFSKQLKLEGRSDEVLLDYRLTLIDTIAHLCEMYRRSIPRNA